MTRVSVSRAERMCAAAIATLVWFALVLQLYLAVRNAPNMGLTITAVVVNYFSYFTILTNILVALALTATLIKGERFFARAGVRSAIAVYIAIVGAVYSLALRELWAPEGLQKIADVILHDASPLLYVIFWAVFVPRNSLRWRDALVWLGYPLAYVVWSVVHGIVSGWWPYPFVDVNALGWTRVIGNTLGLLVVFWIVGLIAVAVKGRARGPV